MIRETTNPKYLNHTQKFRPYKVYERSGPSEPEYLSQASRDWSQGKLSTENFRDRLPHEAPIREPEPDSNPRPKGSSIWIADQSPDAPLWYIKDRTTGHILARVRGSLVWVVDQMRLMAHQLGGLVNDLFYQRAQS